MSLKSKSKRKKFRKDNKLKELKVEIIPPTPERIAKGDLTVGQDNIFRSICPTIIDKWAAIGRLGDEADLVTITRMQSFARLHDLAMAAGIQGVTAMDLSKSAGGGASSCDDATLNEKTARDRYNSIMGFISDSRHRAILTQLCVTPDEEPPFSVNLVLESLDALSWAFAKQSRLVA